MDQPGKRSKKDEGSDVCAISSAVLTMKVKPCTTPSLDCVEGQGRQPIAFSAFTTGSIENKQFYLSRRQLTMWVAHHSAAISADLTFFTGTGIVHWLGVFLQLIACEYHVKSSMIHVFFVNLRRRLFFLNW